MAKYPDTPLSNFPDKEDNWARMSDLSSSLITLATQYNTLYESGDLGGANLLLENNPALKNTIFNAEKWNMLRDAIIALQRFYLKDVEVFIERVAQFTLGINDNPTTEEKATCTYSAKKLDSFIDVVNVTLPASGWSASAPYTQTVNVSGVTAADNPIVSLYLPDGVTAANVKLQTKAYGCLDKGVTGAGKITFTCYNKKPASDFSVAIKGV